MSAVISGSDSMTQVVVLIAIFGGGVALGWFLRGCSAHARTRIYQAAGAVVFGAPVALFLIANVVGSDTLAFVAGLSLMAMLSLAPLLGAGLLVGWALARRLRPKTPAVDVEPKPRRL